MHNPKRKSRNKKENKQHVEQGVTTEDVATAEGKTPTKKKSRNKKNNLENKPNR